MPRSPEAGNFTPSNWREVICAYHPRRLLLEASLYFSSLWTRPISPNRSQADLSKEENLVMETFKQLFLIKGLHSFGREGTHHSSAEGGSGKVGVERMKSNRTDKKKTFQKFWSMLLFWTEIWSGSKEFHECLSAICRSDLFRLHAERHALWCLKVFLIQLT